MSSFYGGGAGSGSAGSGGTSGVGIANIEINEKYHLIVYLTDGTKKDLGRVRGTTFTPAIVDGILSWANDEGLANPESFDFNSLNTEDEGEMWFPVDEVTDEDQPSNSDEAQYWERI